MARSASEITGDSGTPLANGFAEFICRLSLKLGASQEAADAAKAAARECIAALSDGHVFTHLHALARETGRPEKEIRALLVESGVAANGNEARKLPLVLDGEGRIYLYRYFE